MTRIISLIAAVAANGAIGFKGGIPWDSPEDRAIFARKTAGGVLVCGRTTGMTLCEIVGQRADDTRTLVSIRSNDGMEWQAYGAWRHKGMVMEPFSIEKVAAHYPDRNIWICGGSRLYAEAMRNPLVTEMHLTFLDCEPDADAFFPRIEDGAPGTIATGTLLNGDVSLWLSCSRTPINEGCHRVYRRI